jgi:hypothetical protein
MIETLPVEDVTLFADVDIEYDIDYDGELTEITSIKWGDVEIMPLLNAKQIGDMEQIVIEQLDTVFKTW